MFTQILLSWQKIHLNSIKKFDILVNKNEILEKSESHKYEIERKDKKNVILFLNF
jgi:hypothetical protein